MKIFGKKKVRKEKGDAYSYTCEGCGRTFDTEHEYICHFSKYHN